MVESKRENCNYCKLAIKDESVAVLMLLAVASSWAHRLRWPSTTCNGAFAKGASVGVESRRSLNSICKIGTGVKALVT